MAQIKHKGLDMLSFREKLQEKFNSLNDSKHVKAIQEFRKVLFDLQCAINFQGSYVNVVLYPSHLVPMRYHIALSHANFQSKMFSLGLELIGDDVIRYRLSLSGSIDECSTIEEVQDVILKYVTSDEMLHMIRSFCECFCVSNQFECDRRLTI